MSEKPSALVKCILIGESGVGKTSLVVSYTKDDYPVRHESTAFDTYVVDLRVENQQVNLQICDSGGSPGVRSLRELAYPDVHVIILCFSVVQPETLWALRDRWLPELAASGLNLNPTALETAARIGCLPHQSPNTPRQPGPAFILVGCACDLRNDIKRLLDLSARNELPVNDAVAQRLAVEFGAEAYIECSALTQKQLKKVFDLAVWYGLQAKQAVQNVSNANALSPGPNGRNSTVSSSSRKSKRPRQTSSLQGNDQQHSGATNNGSLSGSQRSIWKKLLCLR
ncbi:unnamed protein product [Hymenolepis diminuta]|uniref:Rho-related GTP-binding protein RhoU n=1 Tax=Hymenolepis diminuta TaxID=6216 RepID=A0A158QDT9_HYMDI|nr:unnamed protein product [Hymenolepis diminuta]VUZ39071.1 unnamed protein product [Hymenolepis diminuta]